MFLIRGGGGGLKDGSVNPKLVAQLLHSYVYMNELCLTKNAISIICPLTNNK